MIVGKVYVQFVVSKTGELKDVVLRRSVHPSLDKEALRVVKSMPKWKPGTLDGETVDSFFTLPITFNLN
ncbi:Gram-negative bacterial tonB protein [compost metagenome]